jgi:hypothetical protein
VPPGVYTIVETQPPGFVDGGEENADPNGPNTVVVGNDRFDDVVLSPFPVRGPFNFGEIASNGSLAGSVYVDHNNNRIRDSGETGIANVTISLQGADIVGNAVLRTTTTNASGQYFIGNLLPGAYMVIESHPAAYVDGLDSAGTAGGVVGNDIITLIILDPNETALSYDFGELGLRSAEVDKRGFIVSNF